MKRILTLVLSLILVLTLIPFSAVSAVAVEGDGETTSATSGATYVDVADYTAFMAQITDGKISKSIRLTGDIVFPENTVIEAEIATLADGVVIDGNGHSMTGFSMSKTGGSMALFAVADNAEVTITDLTIGSAEGAIAYNFTATADTDVFSVLVASVASGMTLNVANVDIYANISKAGGNGNSNNATSVGFVGTVDGIVCFNNCSFNGSVTNKAWAGAYPSVAAFVGQATDNAELTFVHCVNNAPINGQTCAAGFISIMKGKSLSMVNCTNNGNVSGCYRVAGFVADMLPTASSTTYTIRNCVNNGNVSGTKYLAGGFVAYAPFHGKASAYLLIENSVNTGNVTATTAKTTTLGKDMKTGTGGFIGNTTANKTGAVKITSCVNTGDITNTADMVGGIIGSMFIQAAPSINIENTINAGIIKGGCYTGGFVGGLFKWDKLTFKNCLSIGDVTSKGGYAGPFLGAHQDLKDIGGESEPSLGNYCNVSLCRYFCEVTSLDADGNNDTTKVHIGKSGEISKHGKAGDSLYFAGNVCTTGTFSYDNTAKKFTFTKNPALARYYGAQLSKEYVNEHSDTVKDIRFIAVLDEAHTSYDKVGFKYKVTNSAGNSVEGDIKDTNVYNSILADSTGGMTTYTAERLGGEYIFALVLSDVPAVESAKFEITAYAVVGDKEYTEGVSYVVELEDGKCVASYMVIE